MRKRLIVLATVLFVGCGDFVDPGDPDPPRPASIVLSPETLIVNQQETTRVTARVFDQYRKPMDITVTFVSSAADVATVQALNSSDAQVVGVNAGQAVVTATVQGLHAETSVTVRAVPARIVIESGNAQKGNAGQQLRDTLLVRILDRQNAGMSNITITFVVTSGGGSVLPANATT